MNKKMLGALVLPTVMQLIIEDLIVSVRRVCDEQEHLVPEYDPKATTAFLITLISDLIREPSFADKVAADQLLRDIAESKIRFINVSQLLRDIAESN